MELFGKNIHFLRKKCKFTQDHMAKCINVTRTTWGNYENNVSEPDLTKLAEIATLFGVTTDQLLYLDLTQEINLKNYSIQQEQNTDKDNIDTEILDRLNNMAEDIKLLKKGLL